MTLIIHHNPACGTSRDVLGLMRASGHAPRVVEYLKTPPDRAELVDLIRRMGLSVRDLLRRRGTPYDALGLDDPGRSDDQLIGLMLEHPILINRPIVVTPPGVRLCRPPATVLWRGIAVTVGVNWLVKPFSMALLGWLFIGTLFAPLLPDGQGHSYIAGLILLAAAPCTAMVFV